MHKRIYAHLDLSFQINATSLMLVQGSQEKVGDAIFFRARDPTDGREKYCIPATTLKGVWRNAAERILRSFHPLLACDPFAEEASPTQSCSKRFEKLEDTAVAYLEVCPACRLFGSTAHAGLLEMTDAWAVGAPQPVKHTGIAIDRFTGGVKQHALYSYAALPSGTVFSGRLTIQNFEFWQLGLLALVNREMADGRTPVGSGTRRGLGRAKVAWQRAEFRYPEPLYRRAAAGRAGALPSAGSLAADAEPWLLPGLQPRPPAGWADAAWVTFDVASGALEQLARECVEKTLAFRLQDGLAGFAYTPPVEKEARHA
jgi:CRISPR/Cas system CSM-associated protein Csm3 (group 7 of RAMP superfamily)